MEDRIEFYCESMKSPDSLTQWRATLSGNYVTWGYGETHWEAIAQLCEQYAEEDEMNGEQETGDE